jgi:anti-sigma regulatory factor (Ser/Thr protein kinase)
VQPLAVAVADASHASAARLEGQRLARHLGFDETGSGRIAIAITEAVTNMLRHAGGGLLLAQPAAVGESLGLEVLAIDRGPGMSDFSHSSRDGISTSGTSGTGLGAMQRLADEFDVYTAGGAGAILRMMFWRDARVPARPPYEVGGVSVPKPGEAVCGDAWRAEIRPAGVTVLVADGLGHGPEAARASNLALEVLRRHPAYSAARLLEAAHGRLRATRGAAIAVARHDAHGDPLTFAGVGNIAASLWDGASRRSMVSHNGIVGHNVHRSVEYHYSWPPGALLLMHSDGLETHWNLDAFPGILRCHASIIAAALYREHTRKRDDAVVVVARRTT